MHWHLYHYNRYDILSILRIDVGGRNLSGLYSIFFLGFYLLIHIGPPTWLDSQYPKTYVILLFNNMYIILWMPLFSWVPIFVEWTKITHSWGSKSVAIVFSLIIHTKKIAVSRVLEFVDQTLHENHENWYPMKIILSTILDKRLTLNISSAI